MEIGETKTYSTRNFTFQPSMEFPRIWSMDDLAWRIFITSPEIQNASFLVKDAFHLHISTFPRSLTIAEREELEEIRLIGYLFTYDGDAQ